MSWHATSHVTLVGAFMFIVHHSAAFCFPSFAKGVFGSLREEEREREGL